MNKMFIYHEQAFGIRKQKMKIILFALNGRGGMLHYTSQFANALSKKADVSVILPSYSDTSLFDKSVNLIRIKAPYTIFGSVIESIKIWNHLLLIRKIKSINPDVIHIMDSHPWYLIYPRLLKRYKLIVTQHDPTLHEGESKSILNKVIDKTNKYLRSAADKIIVHGENLKQDMISKGMSGSKIVVVAHGDYSFFTRIGKSVETDKDTILCFGRIVKYKGIDTLLSSIRYIKQKIPNIKVIIAGEGDFSPYQELITEDIDENIQIINEFIPDEKVSELFQKAAVVVLPYNEATQSGIIPIAYAFKKPVITTNVGSLPEVVDDGKTGYIVEPRNPEQLAAKVVELLQNEKDLKEFGENGYKKMKEMMDWGDIAQQIYKESYEEED